MMFGTREEPVPYAKEYDILLAKLTLDGLSYETENIGKIALNEPVNSQFSGQFSTVLSYNKRQFENHRIFFVNEKVKAIICLGIDNDKLINAFGGMVDVIVETQFMSEAVKIAYKVAEAGDNVLLSPACASFDLFENYEDRGRQFKEAVRNL